MNQGHALQLYRFIEVQSKRRDLNSKLTWAMTRTLSKLEDFMKNIREIGQVDEKLRPVYEEYSTKRLALCEKLSDKGTDGKPIMIQMGGDKSYSLKLNAAEFEKSWGALKLEYAEVLDAQAKAEIAINDILEDECDVKPYMVSSAYIPDNTYNIDELKMLSPMIKDEEE